jgi:hypothetical protein
LYSGDGIVVVRGEVGGEVGGDRLVAEAMKARLDYDVGHVKACSQA